ncbi:MAG: M15 family metallopeptidase [Paenibacillaceae bacterium]
MFNLVVFSKVIVQDFTGLVLNKEGVNDIKKIGLPTMFMILTIVCFTGCNKQETTSAVELSSSPVVAVSPETPAPTEEASSPTPPEPAATPKVTDTGKTETPYEADSLSVVAEPDSVIVLVNKHFALPKDYEPSDLIYPDVPFIFKEKVEKRKMRSVAAKALKELFSEAEKDNIQLAGASAYRSYATQKTLFQRYVQQDGLEKARTYSAIAGTSEHETGLAIDVSGVDGKCAAQDCFAGTKEAIWLGEHAAEYGFIVRYPEGKEAITGYMYEPWHLRYVGKEIAKEISANDSTLENYLNAVPVSK